jgi:hypothetical protein
MRPPHALNTTVMPAPHEDEIQLYGSVLNSIKMRLARVPPLLTFPLSNGKATIDRHQLEYAALQLRMAIESIALASLVANRRDLEAASIAFHRKGADAAGKVVKKLNPNYWPRPINVIPATTPGESWRLEPITNGFLQECEWRSQWGYLSSLLHAKNPFTSKPDKVDKSWALATAKRLGGIHDCVLRLMSYHQVTLVDQNVVLTALLNAKEDGLVHVQTHVRQDMVAE